MKTVALIGANGFVGSEIANAIINEKRYSFIPVTRHDNLEEVIKKAEVVIHAANSGKRFFAENNPEIDFKESVEKTAIIKKLSINKRLILISSISARTQLDTTYGRNRRSCELIVDEASLVVRLGPMFGEGKVVGALSNIIKNETVYVAPSTSYAFTDVGYNAKKIVSFIDDSSLSGCTEIGARNGIVLDELAKILGSTSVFKGTDDTQIPISPQEDAPDAEEVINFAKTQICN